VQIPTCENIRFESADAAPESLARLWADRILAAFSLALLAPGFALAAIAVWLDDGSPVLFRQTRVGRGGKHFTLFKFRSMFNRRVDAGAGALLTASGDQRVTRSGRFLRKFKIDELPQLWNVLRGEMSLVGPRPEVPRYVDTSQAVWRTVLGVRPGITDVATLLYRDEERILAGFDDPEKGYRETVLPDKLALNLAYLGRRSWFRDAKLLALTARYSFVPGAVDTEKLRKLILP
jgi:lipopolysaccharide/colanic/teichoic acid biosynthesis glycosyltransferase